MYGVNVVSVGLLLSLLLCAGSCTRMQSHGRATNLLATGLVATSTITHATPASFVAHVPSRSQEGVP